METSASKNQKKRKWKKVSISWNSCNHFKVYEVYKSPIQKGF